MNLDETTEESIFAAVATTISAVCSAAVSTSLVIRNSPTNKLTVTNFNFDEIMADENNDQWFRDNVRCSKASFQYICDLLKPYCNPKLFRTRKHSYEKKVAIALYYLAFCISIVTKNSIMNKMKYLIRKTRS